MFFQEINFLKKNFFSNSALITDLIFRLNSKYIGFLFYLISVVIMGRYFVSGSIISCETGDVITSKAMISVDQVPDNYQVRVARIRSGTR